MDIGIVGAGNIGKAAATRLVAAGHRIRIANSRGPETLAAFEQELGEAATAGSAEEAAAFGPVVILAVPLKALAALPAEALAEKIVVDAGNYDPERDGQIEAIQSGELGSSEYLQTLLEGSTVVKALNTMASEDLTHKALPAGAAGRLAFPIAGDDEEAKRTVAGMIDDMGFDAVDDGSLRDGRRLQPGTPVYAVLMDADEVRAGLEATTVD